MYDIYVTVSYNWYYCVCLLQLLEVLSLPGSPHKKCGPATAHHTRKPPHGFILCSTQTLREH